MVILQQKSHASELRGQAIFKLFSPVKVTCALKVMMMWMKNWPKYMLMLMHLDWKERVVLLIHEIMIYT